MVSICVADERTARVPEATASLLCAGDPPSMTGCGKLKVALRERMTFCPGVGEGARPSEYTVDGLEEPSAFSVTSLQSRRQSLSSCPSWNMSREALDSIAFFASSTAAASKPVMLVSYV